MEIEIGGRSEKSLGGQESAAVDQECMGSNASSCSFALSFPIPTAFFLPEPVSCQWGQRIALARSNGKRNRSFTKNITTFATVVEVLFSDSNVFSSFFLSILRFETFVCTTRCQDTLTKMYLAYRELPPIKMVITSWKIVMQAHTNQPIERLAWHWSCA